MPAGHARLAGFTLVEVMVSLLIGAFVVAGLAGAVSGTLAIRAEEQARVETVRATEFALDRMVRAVGRTSRLVLPLNDDPGTAWSESVRDPGVLAVALDHALDRDRNGVADADNDGDGRIDEDFGPDASNDAKNGLVAIDDDNDGAVDEGGTDGTGLASDDDEDGAFNEDPENGADDDGDGTADEDNPNDMNGDGASGIAGVDDDGDATVDEGPPPDDDEASPPDDDWLDAVVYFLDGDAIVERMPNPNPADGTDYTEREIAEDVTQFRVERLPAAARGTLVEIRIDVVAGDGEVVSLTTRVRVGGLL